MKKIGCLLLALIVLSANKVFSEEGLFPSLEEVYGIEIPSFTDTIKKYPDSTEKKDQEIIYLYSGVSDKDYYNYGDALQQADCTVSDYHVDGNEIVVICLKKGREFSFCYDHEESVMKIIMPEGFYDEPKMTPAPTFTPSPTETPAPINFSSEAGYSIDLGEQMELSLFPGASLQIQGKIKSEDKKAHNDIQTTWDSSNVDVATVDGNNNRAIVTGISEGTAVITCRSLSEEDVYSMVFVHVKSVIGETVLFGNYEQDKNPKNGKESIEWIIINTRDDEVLLLSKILLDSQKYSNGNKNENCNWKNSAIRKWLNNQFLNTAFNAKEKKEIVKSVIITTYPDETGKTETQDSVFLLSSQEHMKYNYIPEVRDTYPSISASTVGRADDYWLRCNIKGRSALAISRNEKRYYEADRDEYIRPAIWVKYQGITQ